MKATRARRSRVKAVRARVMAPSCPPLAACCLYPLPSSPLRHFAVQHAALMLPGQLTVPHTCAEHGARLHLLPSQLTALCFLMQHAALRHPAGMTMPAPQPACPRWMQTTRTMTGTLSPPGRGGVTPTPSRSSRRRPTPLAPARKRTATRSAPRGAARTRTEHEAPALASALASAQGIGFPGAGAYSPLWRTCTVT